jgi:hypothetical protein
VSDQPLDGNERISGEEVLEVDLPDHLNMDDYQLVEDGRPYHQWCLPASLLNGFPRRLLSKEQVETVRDGFL